MARNWSRAGTGIGAEQGQELERQLEPGNGRQSGPGNGATAVTMELEQLEPGNETIVRARKWTTVGAMKWNS